MTNANRRRVALALAAAPALLLACTRKEAPPPVAQAPPSAAPTTTTLPPPTTVPTPPPAWRAARWGMTKEEVLAAFPGEAERLPQPVPFSQPQPGSSLLAGSTDVAIAAYEADGSKFRILFGFDSEVLNRVHLSAAKAGPATCGDLETALTQKHSDPANRATTGSSLRGQEIVWKRPDQTIVLGCAGVPSLGFQSVTLDYFAPSVSLAQN